MKKLLLAALVAALHVGATYTAQITNIKNRTEGTLLTRDNVNIGQNAQGDVAARIRADDRIRQYIGSTTEAGQGMSFKVDVPTMPM